MADSGAGRSRLVASGQSLERRYSRLRRVAYLLVNLSIHRHGPKLRNRRRQVWSSDSTVDRVKWDVWLAALSGLVVVNCPQCNSRFILRSFVLQILKCQVVALMLSCSACPCSDSKWESCQATPKAHDGALHSRRPACTACMRWATRTAGGFERRSR